MNFDGNYVQLVIQLIEQELRMKNTPYEGLLEVYALLAMTVGVDCTNKHVHDAWSIWQSRTQPKHKSLLPFEQLTKEVQDLDEPYRLVIIKVAEKLNQ